MLDNERVELGRKAGNGDLQAALKLVGLLTRDSPVGNEVFKIRRRSDGAWAHKQNSTTSFNGGKAKGSVWSTKAAIIGHLGHWFNRSTRWLAGGVMETGKHCRDNRYAGCDLVRYVTLEVSAEDVITLCKNKWGGGK